MNGLIDLPWENWYGRSVCFVYQAFHLAAHHRLEAFGWPAGAASLQSICCLAAVGVVLDSGREEPVATLGTVRWVGGSAT